MTPLRRLLCLSLLLLAAAAAPAAEPAVLTVPRLEPFESLDPPRAFDTATDQVVHAVYSTLLTYAYLERPYKLEPDLLETLPTLSPDGLLLTFRLRHGVRFADNPCFAGGKGRELVADDVLFSLRRFADARLNDKSWFAMSGAVAGLDDYRAATAKAAPDADLTATAVAGLRKVDDWTFTVRLTHPNPLFLYALTMSPTAIVAPEAVRFYKDRLGVNAVGTGPFVLAGEAARKGTLRLQKNPAYYRSYPVAGEPGDAARGLLRDAGQRLPLVDVLEMPLIEEAQPAALKFLRGEIDWRMLDRANFTRLVKRRPDGGFAVADDAAGRFGISYAPSPGVAFVVLNMKDPLLGRNKALRQALAAAIDSQAMIDVLLNGRGRVLGSIVPFALAGSERETGAPPPRHDPALARRLLAQAGYPGGAGLPPLTVSFYQSDAETHNVFDLWRAQFAAVGVQLKGAFLDLPTFNRLTGAGSFQLAVNVYTADYPDAENFYQLLYGPNATPGTNMGSFADPAYDRAYEASRYLPEGAKRLEWFKAMNAVVADQAPVIGLFNPLAFGIHQRWVSNFKRNMLVPENMYLRVDMAAKRQGGR